MKGDGAEMRAHQHRRQTERNLIVGGLLILVVVGGGLIALIYGPPAACSGLLCIGTGVGLFVGLYLILKLMELWVARED